jgi:cysteine desulfurase/selenocysteine lyase
LNKFSEDNDALDLLQIRADFPILDQQVNGHPLVYFDNAASTQKPLAVLDALRQFATHDHANVHRGLHALSTRATDAFEKARAVVARFLGASTSDEIIFTRGTTEAINLVAQTWGATHISHGDVILLTELEHHSNLVPWQMLAARTGARLRFVPIGEDGTLALVRLASLLDGAKLFAFTHISNSLGTINPARELCQAARAAGVVTLVDAAQSAGHMPIDVAEIGCDFLALSGHKMCGPTGIGVLYGRADLLEEMPPWHGGGEMIVSVDWERSSFKKAPHRFEAGTPHISGAIGLAAAIAYLEDVGRGRIFAHDQQLAAYALEQLGAVRGVRVIGPRAGQARAGVVSFVMDAAHPHDLTTYADQGGLALRGGHHCNQPLMRKLGLPGTARASFYLYNTRAEIDRMLQILEDAHRFFS